MNCVLYQKSGLNPFKNVFLIIFALSFNSINAQQNKIDSLKNTISLTKEDTVKIFLYEDLGQAYRDEKKMDSSVLSFKQALQINERITYSLQKQCWDIAAIQFILYEMGNYSESLNYASRQLELTEIIKDTFQMGFAHATFGHNYKALGEYRLALNHYFNARQIFFRYFHFTNSDKREITLFDEMETCKLYTQLESMRFGKKFSYHFNIDETIDQKSILVPALIIQPFIENAIWHGIMPKEYGGILNVSIYKSGDVIYCSIEDDGIGREVSRQNKFSDMQSTHQSKGVHLTQSRLDLNNALNQKSATLEIIDKKDDNGNSLGTLVVLTFLEF